MQTATGGALTPGTADYKTPTWGGTSACNSCHDTGPGIHSAPLSASYISSGSHSRHLSYLFTVDTTIVPNDWIDKCAICHSTGSNGSLDPNYCTKCHNSYPDPSHANGVINIRFTDIFGGTAAMYNDPTGAPGNGFSTCSNTYCHSAATGGTVHAGETRGVAANTTPNWGAGTLTCDSCHTGGTVTGPTYPTGSPKANSHNKHVVGNNYKCVDCHRLTVDASNVIINGTAFHVNAVYNVSGAMINTYTYASDGGTCTTSCHGSTTPKWGVSLTCGSCHAANNTLAGSHSKHYQTATAPADRSAANNSTATEYRFNCGVCHFNAPHAMGPENGNRTAQVAFDGTIGSGTFAEGGISQTDPVTGLKYTNSTCSTSYCHGKYPGSGKNATPTWGTASSGACGTCHGASNNSYPQYPNSGSHFVHAEGGEHGYACTMCHKGVIGGTAPASYTINDKAKHVNGSIDWSFDAGDIRLKGGSEVYSIASGTTAPSDGTTRAYGTCNNLYCHSIVQTASGGALTPGTADYKTPTWGGTSPATAATIPARGFMLRLPAHSGSTAVLIQGIWPTRLRLSIP